MRLSFPYVRAALLVVAASLAAACKHDAVDPPDRTAPTVTITSPATASPPATNVATLSLAGSASDDHGVVRVEWSSDRGGSGAATGTASWSASVPLLDGTNVVTVRALDEEGNVGSAQATVVLDTVAPQVSIASQNLEKWVATASPTFALGGVAADNRGVHHVTWSSSRGGSGTATGTTAWSVSAPLQAGDNRLTVTAFDEAGNSAQDAFTVTYNPGLQIGAPVADPGGVLVGAAQQVRVTAALGAQPGLVAGSVKLLRVDANGASPTTLASLADDGVLTHGDEILGDGVYSGLVTLNEAQAGQVRLRVSAQVQSGGSTVESLSAVTAVVVYAPISTEEYQQVTTTQEAALARAGTLAPTVGLGAALDSTARWLSARSEVQSAVLGADGTIRVEYRSGLLGGVSIRQAATGTVTQGGVPSLSAAPAAWAGLAADTLPRRVARVPLAAQTRGTAGPLFARAGAPRFSAAKDPDEVNSRRVLIYDPFAADFGEKGAAARDIIAKSDLKFDVTYLRGSAATIAALAGMSAYGLVLIDTHGAGGEYLFTGETSTTANLKKYEGLLRERKLAVFDEGEYRTGEGIKAVGRMYAVTPRFVRGISGSFPRSIVVNSSCESTQTDALWLAFKDKGAAAYYGYSQIVWSGFAKTVWTDLVTKLVVQLKTAGESYTEQTDPSSPHAVFQRRGNEKAHFGSGLINGDFEAGTLEGWTPAGDGRVITRLGPQAPTGGAFMGILSTGLGYTTATGSIRQAFRVSSTDSLLTVRWNFLSEEFLEYVGSQYQDYFRVTVQDSLGTKTPFERNIDQFYAGFTLASVSPAISFDQGDVYMTGWRTLTVDLRPYRGKVITLTFAVGDVGDSIYDSAVLLDDVTVQ